MKRFVLAFVVVALTGAIPNGRALAATPCNTTITGTVSGGLTVSAGQTCILNGAIVTGGVNMTGGALEACGSTISGGVSVTGGNCVALGFGSGDDVILSPFHSPCPGDSISGGVSVANVDNDPVVVACPDSISDVEIDGSTVSGGVTLDNNDKVEVEQNIITGGLHCTGNVSVTDDGIPNIVITGGQTGQCASPVPF